MLETLEFLGWQGRASTAQYDAWNHRLLFFSLSQATVGSLQGIYQMLALVLAVSPGGLPAYVKVELL